MSPTAPEPTTGTAGADSTAPHQALYRRWRAQTFSEIVGQTAVVETLRNAVRTDRVSHAVLFVGPRGTGKTSLARILAKALNCTNLQDGDPCDRCEACVSIREGRALDLIEIDAASNRGIDAIRDLRERIQYAPTDLRRKVYILDEAHQITKDAWNALLKSLEEPPDFVAFMFASTHPQDFPPAILSRLQRYDVRRLTVEEIEGKLARILAAESVAAEPGAVRLIARLAAGGMRDAESILDQVLASAGATIDEASVRDLLGLADAEAIDRLTAALVDGDAGAGHRRPRRARRARPRRRGRPRPDPRRRSGPSWPPRSARPAIRLGRPPCPLPLTGSPRSTPSGAASAASASRSSSPSSMRRRGRAPPRRVDRRPGSPARPSRAPRPTAPAPLGDAASRRHLRRAAAAAARRTTPRPGPAAAAPATVPCRRPTRHRPGPRDRSRRRRRPTGCRQPEPDAVGPPADARRAAPARLATAAPPASTSSAPPGRRSSPPSARARRSSR